MKRPTRTPSEIVQALADLTVPLTRFCKAYEIPYRTALRVKLGQAEPSFATCMRLDDALTSHALPIAKQRRSVK